MGGEQGRTASGALSAVVRGEAARADVTMRAMPEPVLDAATAPAPRRAARPRRFAVVGAGPAGLIAGITARRLGMRVTVYEAAPDFARIGGGIVLAANGLQVLDTLGLLEGFRPHMRFETVGTIESPPGVVAARTDLSELAVPHAGFAAVLRYELQEYLLAAARALGVDLRFGARCTGAQGTADEAVLRFDGGERAVCDVVIACDGVHSQVRSSLRLRAHQRAIGEAYLRGVSHHVVPAMAEKWASDGRRFGVVPLAGERTYFFCSAPFGRWSDVRDGGLDAWLASWNDFGDDVRAVLAAVEDWPSVNYDELREVWLDRWAHPPFFFAGDAAHAMTPNLGQGANSAMVDALVLVRLLHMSADPATVGREYDRLRRAFVRRVQTASRRVGELAARQGPAARWLATALMRASEAVPLLRRMGTRLAAGYNPPERMLLEAPMP